MDELSPVEVATIENIQGNSDPLPGIITKVISKVRGMIKAGGNPLDQTGNTIPDQLVEEVVAMARWKWLNSVPALKSLKTKERADANTAAEALLKEISSNSPNRPRTELPATADAVASPVNAISVARRGRHLRTNSFDKLGET